MRKRNLRTFAAALIICVLFVANAVPAFAEGATVTGEDVNLRSGPGTNYRVLDCLPKGASVTVTDRSNSSWYGVSYNGTNGFMSSHYLSLSGGGSSSGSPSGGSAEANGYINAMYVRFRSAPSTDGSILGEYNRGKELTITGSENGWTACIIDGQSGYVSGQYVTAYGDGGGSDQDEYDPYGGIVVGGGSGSDGYTGGGTTEPEPDPGTSPEPSDPYGGDSIVVGGSSGGETTEPEPEPPVSPSPTPSTTPVEEKTGFINGDYVRFRTGPSTSYRVIDSYNKGKEVTITGVSGDWTACTIDGQNGYVFSQYVTVNEPKTQTGGSETNGGDDNYNVTETDAQPGYITGNNVRLRSGPSMSSDVLDELFYGNNVTITGVSGDWTAVTYNGQAGFVYSQYVARGEYQHTSSGGSDLGREIADFALQFVGYGYTWGGTSPSTGFDCSGLMYYVYQHFGYTLNRVADAQARNGVHVDPSELQPGDLLCFYSSGSYIGHVGMYIGNNMFVHAQNSATGVVISELSGYYATRGFEARRII